MADIRVVLDQGAIDALLEDPDVDAAIGDVADGVAEEIAARARRVLGGSDAGPDSIHAEPAEDGPGFDVSWTEEHFYLSFAELGTEHEQARPFARPVADEINRRRS